MVEILAFKLLTSLLELLTADGQTDRLTDEKINRWTDTQMARHTYGQSHRRTVTQTDSHTEGQSHTQPKPITGETHFWRQSIL